MQDLKAQFGNIDIYLFDQLLKGRLTPEMRILDAGCGRGRNIRYLLQNGFDVTGIDADQDAITYVQSIAKRLAPDKPANRFAVGEIAYLPFEPAAFDVVISSAVLHFAKNEAHFHKMVDEMWRVLKPGGFLFARLASTIGIEKEVEPLEGRWFALPDGSNRFLVDQR
ncbi:MAG: class I SAM-dependent methyltransferase, partial [Rhodothermales bacterium]